MGVLYPCCCAAVRGSDLETPAVIAAFRVFRGVPDLYPKRFVWFALLWNVHLWLQIIINLIEMYTIHEYRLSQFDLFELSEVLNNCIDYGNFLGLDTLLSSWLFIVYIQYLCLV